VAARRPPCAVDRRLAAGRLQALPGFRKRHAVQPELSVLHDRQGLWRVLRHVGRRTFVNREELGRYQPGVLTGESPVWVGYSARLAGLLKRHLGTAFKLWRRDPELSGFANRQKQIRSYLAMSESG